MTGPTLCQQIDAREFSDDAAELFATLTSVTVSHEAGAVILVAAALLLAREFPDNKPHENEALYSLGEEFIDLMFEARKRLRTGICRPALRVVGGLDVD